MGKFTDEIDRVDRLIEQVLTQAEKHFSSEERPHVIVDSLEKLTRVKQRMYEVDELHRRNTAEIENMSAGKEPMRITFDISVEPMRCEPTVNVVKDEDDE